MLTLPSGVHGDADRSIAACARRPRDRMLSRYCFSATMTLLIGSPSTLLPVIVPVYSLPSGEIRTLRVVVRSLK